jgi:hypothetical protein
MEADAIIRRLGLLPHPEGGHYVEVFRARLQVRSAVHDSVRRASTAIYFLLRAGEFSAWHRVRCDEAWHFYRGDPLELFTLDAEAGLRRAVLGPDLERGERPLFVVGAGLLQAARVTPGGRSGYALMGCTVAPGFEFDDFELPPRSELLERFPEHAAVLGELSR